MNIRIKESLLFSNGLIPFTIALVIMIIMPVYHWFIPPFIILWLLYSISRIRSWQYDIIKINIKHKILFVLFFLFFFWQLTGILYSENTRGGWRNIELHLSIIIFPLVMIMPGAMIRNKYGLLLKIFALSTFVFLVFCYLVALYRSLSIENGQLIFNPILPKYTWLNYFYALEFAIFQHTSYLSMFTMLSFFIAIEAFFDKSVPENNRLFWLMSGLVMIVSIYFLSSRAGILAAIITVPLYFTLKLKNHVYRKFLALLLGLITFLFIVVAFTNPRVNNYLKWREEKKIADVEVKNDRVIIWKAASELLKDNFLMGVGTGDIQDELNKIYLKNGYPNLARVNTNSHNQYLEIILENGLVGIIIFALMFINMFNIAIKDKNMIYLMFLLIVIISFLFETMLNRLAGVTFFSLFSFLLLLNNNKENTENSNKNSA